MLLSRSKATTIKPECIATLLADLKLGGNLSRVMDRRSQRASGGRFSLEPDPAIIKLEYTDIDLLAPKVSRLNSAKTEIDASDTRWHDSRNAAICAAD